MVAVMWGWFLPIFVFFLSASPVVAFADLDLPVKGTITSGVGWRPDPFGSGKLVFHRGIDIAVPVGTPVHATRRGRVLLAGDDHHGHGATVILEHDNGDRTLYGHNSVVLVHRGESVEAGAVIAFSGSSGRSTGPHVHYERQPGGRLMNPGRSEFADIALRQRTQSGEEPWKKGAAERAGLERQLDDAMDSIIKQIGASIPARPGG